MTTKDYLFIFFYLKIDVIFKITVESKFNSNSFQIL
jgi:hypothetical protein